MPISPDSIERQSATNTLLFNAMVAVEEVRVTQDKLGSFPATLYQRIKPDALSLTHQAYETMAVVYDREAARFWRRFPLGFIENYRNHLPPNGRVLNVGSGPGWDSKLLSLTGLEVICLDACVSMTRLTSERGFTTVQGDFRRLPFSRGVFDGAWAYTSLIHVPKTEFVQTLAEIGETLVSGGILGMGMLRGSSEHFSTSYGMGNPRFIAYYTKPELMNALIFAGFEVVHYEKMQRVGTKSGRYHNIIARRV
ncbi:class I SAM-dependent methyltransferase [Candidatus Daviesbacteria bacterium]|nr:class I SAM-dependent methyltransferase [Candidatus Daviesbacteria bacterium]